MIVVVKVLERRGNRTFWHERACIFFGSPCDSTFDHSHQLTEIITTVRKKKWEKKKWRQRISHCNVCQIFDIILKSLKNTAFLGIEDYRGSNKCFKPKIRRRIKKILSQIKKRQYYVDNSHFNARIWNILYHKSRVC